MKKLQYIIFILCLLTGGLARGGEDESIEPVSGITLFLKIVTYDDSFVPSELNGLVVYLVYDNALPHSYEQMVTSREFLSSNTNLRVAGLSVEAVDISVDKMLLMDQVIDSNQYHLVLVTDIENATSVSKISAVCQKLKIRSFSLEPEYVEDGVSVSIRAMAAKNKILVNLSAAKAEGSSFDPRFLAMCEILSD